MAEESRLAIVTFKDRGARAELDLVIGICSMQPPFAALEVEVGAIMRIDPQFPHSLDLF